MRLVFPYRKSRDYLSEVAIAEDLDVSDALCTQDEATNDFENEMEMNSDDLKANGEYFVDHKTPRSYLDAMKRSHLR